MVGNMTGTCESIENAEAFLDDIRAYGHEQLDAYSVPQIEAIVQALINDIEAMMCGA